MFSGKRKEFSSDENGQGLSVPDQDRIGNAFEKKFVYEACEISDKLQNAADFTDIGNNQWEVPEYMEMKSEMNDLKSSLNDKDLIKWHIHTKRVHLAGKVVPSIRHRFRVEFCTQAWCKFYEIACSYLRPERTMPFFSVHLCEAPGAFITSLNHYLYTTGHESDWSWLATTLHPYYEGNSVGEMIEDDRLIRCTYDNWYFGEDGTGNLMSRKNMEGLKEMLGDVYVNLVTADGSIDCQENPAEQENIVSWLHHCESLTALQILSPGGAFVLKMFTMFESTSVSLMYLLNCLFTEVNVFKPCCSKGGNSEVYVVCLNYKGRQLYQTFLDSLTPVYFSKQKPACPIFKKSEIPESFFKQHTKCVKLFREHQRSAILRNLDLFTDLQDEERSRLNIEQDFCVKSFLKRYGLKFLVFERRLLPKDSKVRYRIQRANSPEESWDVKYAKQVKLDGRLQGSLLERQQIQTLPWKQKVKVFETYEEEVEHAEGFSKWIMKSKAGLKDLKVGYLEPLFGQTVTEIQNSPFCHGRLVAQVREVIQNVQWLSETPDCDQVAVTQAVRNLKNAIKSCFDETSTKCDNHLSLSSIKVDSSLSVPTETSVVSRINDCYSSVQTEISNSSRSVRTGKSDSYPSVLSGISDSHSCEQTEISDSNLSVQTEMSNGYPSVESGISDGHSSEQTEISESNPSVQSVKSDIYPSMVTGISDGHSSEQTEISDSNLSAQTEISDGYPSVESEISDGHSSEQTEISDSNPSVQTGKRDHVPCEQSKIKYENSERDRQCIVSRGVQSVVFIQLEDWVSSDADLKSKVHIFSTISPTVGKQFELCDQIKLLKAVIQIVQTCAHGDLVVIEMGSCLTRITVGLVYILYQCFNKIGFLHQHGNYFHQHLVCVSYECCLIEMGDYLQSVYDVMNTNQSGLSHINQSDHWNTDQSESILEIIPIIAIVNDEEFVTFLHSTNTYLLQSFITTVIKREKGFYTGKQTQSKTDENFSQE